MNRRTDGRIDGRTEGWTNERMDRWMFGRMDWQMDSQTDGRRGGQTEAELRSVGQLGPGSQVWQYTVMSKVRFLQFAINP